MPTMPASWATAQRATGLLLYSCLFLLLPTRTSAAPLTEANAKWNVNLEERHAPESYRGEWRNHTYFPSPGDWRSLSIYQLITDRFADGEPRNNDLYQGGFDVRDMTYRHGGDFLGLTQKLPYIKGMGCQGIWISPIFQNGFNSYHQYSQTDFTLLDQRLGTLDELRQLADSAHRLGMYVIVDVVMNHMGNEFFFEGHQGESAPFRIHEEGSRREYHLRPRRSNSDLHWTPAGRQPYIDFWYNNTWDADASYPGTLYGQHGEPVEDQGQGTYSSSDFHHNGDLQDYYDPFQIHFGKLYGTMDDLRLEHARVQQKYIAMSKALISSCDIDGFRVDTPMQVPLNFYKAWAPAVREHAKSLGKASFGLFGEFYVTPERYATMTGRGRDRNMYGTDRFIDGPATMKGGIVYSYYWYMFTAFVYSQPQYADGFALAYAEERSMIDVYDPANAQNEYAMWNFCNNHDNWRLQSMTSTRHLHVCLVVITFWPGIPLHYAGDEQNFDSPGSALDGWAREELGASLAWQAVPTHQSGNVASRDNFDMTSGNYLFIARLNALRRAHFESFGSEECDKLMTPSPPIQDVLAFIRGCSEEQRVAVLANFHGTETREALLWSPWQEHTELQDIIATSGQLRIVVGAGGRLQTSLPPLAAVALVPGLRRSIPPSVVAVSPSHAAVLSGPAGTVQIVLSFDQPMHSSAADGVSLDGFAGMFSCMTANCTKVAATMLFETFCDGVHVVEALE
ncbi:ags1, partial [Symbiodinium sp. CCMP2456]